MKKIVALVLSLVMVLGLATTAFAATSYGNMYLQATDVPGAGIATTPVTLTSVKAVAPTYDKVTGQVTGMGAVAYLSDTVNAFVPVDSLAAADYVAYADPAGKVVKFYLDLVTDVTYFEGVVFTNFGEGCGQVDMDPVDGVTYYTVKGDLTEAVYASSVTGTSQLMVGGKLVTVDAVPVATTKVAHTVVTEMENAKVVKVYCSACDKVAVEAANYLSIPKGADTTDLFGNWYWAGVAADAAGDKVESAQTFDAGIAMYVGMSVMAAAGSAVVLKKKD